MDYGGLAMLAFMALYGLFAWLRRGGGTVVPPQLSDECALLLNLASSAAQERGDEAVGVAHFVAVASTSPALLPLLRGSGISLDMLRQQAVAELGPQAAPREHTPPFDAAFENLLVRAAQLGEERRGQAAQPGSDEASLELADMMAALADAASGPLKQLALQLNRVVPSDDAAVDATATCCIHLINNDVISIEDAVRLMRLELQVDEQACLLLLFCAQIRGFATLGPLPRELALARCAAVGRLADELNVALELTIDEPDTTTWEFGANGLLPASTAAIDSSQTQAH
jgi:hypothetical protein